MRTQTLVVMAWATLSLGLTLPTQHRRQTELDAILAALGQNNPEDAAAASGGGSSPENPENRQQQGDIDAILAALEQNNPEDAAAASAANPGKGQQQQQQGEDVNAILAALQGTDSEDGAAAAAAMFNTIKRAANDELASILDQLAKNNPDDAAEAGAGLT
ncbi:hypothetical protein PG984_012155 [Apiospora sp. TS-2023a]